MVFKFFWPEIPNKDQIEEAVLLFKFDEKENIVIASNYPYEVYQDYKLIGDGGHRCPPKEAYIDEWPGQVTIRLHWLNSKMSSVYYRCVFNDPFIAVKGDIVMTCYMDASLIFLNKINSHLPCQNLVVRDFQTMSEMTELPLNIYEYNHWKLKPFPVKRSIYTPIELKWLSTNKLPTQKTGGLDVLNDMKLVPDLLTFAYYQRNINLTCTTYDLGQIGLHRFQIEVSKTDEKNTFGGILCYSETANFKKAWDTANRRKVHLSDGFLNINGNQLIPFGQRGCRYVHLLTPTKSQIQVCLKVWRRDYPYTFKKLKSLESPLSNQIRQACIKNLMAVTDGGLVDTCWRERTQWTGDVRMSVKAVMSLTDNPEIPEFVLHQIATSYQSKLGMVSGCWPVQNTDFHLTMPTFHLAFCLTAIESNCQNPLVLKVIKHSMNVWRTKYLIDGILTGIYGWNFVDWDFVHDGLIAKAGILNGPNAVVHAWWFELCHLMEVDSGIDIQKFHDMFWTGSGFALLGHRDGADENNIHATSAVLACPHIFNNQKDIALAYRYINSQIENKAIYECVTPYFAYFIAKILPSGQDINFIQKYYGQMIKTYGTIQEKVGDDSSLAHGWSIGIAEILAK